MCACMHKGAAVIWTDLTPLSTSHSQKTHPKPKTSVNQENIFAAGNSGGDKI